MSDLKQARLLLIAAERDSTALHGMGDPDVFPDEIFGFHAPQAVEKLLKAWLASLGGTCPLSYDLASLLDMLGARDLDIARFDEVVDYVRYAVRLRYAPTDPDVKPLDRGKVFGQVDALLEEVRRRLAEARSRWRRCGSAARRPPSTSTRLPGSSSSARSTIRAGSRGRPCRCPISYAAIATSWKRS